MGYSTSMLTQRPCVDWLAKNRTDWLNYLLVNAPRPYGPGFSWFDFPGDPTPGAEQSYLQLRELLDTQRERGFPTEQTVLFGFSQGGLMVWEAGVRYPHRLAGCVCMSGFMRDPDQLLKARSPVADQQRFCVTHGMMDDLLPIEGSQKQVEWVRQGRAPSGIERNRQRPHHRSLRRDNADPAVHRAVLQPNGVKHARTL